MSGAPEPRSDTGRIDDRRGVLILVARLFLVSAFLVSGVAKLLDFSGATAEVRLLTGIGAGAPIAALVIAVQLGGAGLVLAGGRAGVLGAALLAGFTFAATLLAHTAWVGTGAVASRDAATFFEHMGLIGGFLLLGLHDLKRTADG